MVKFDDNSSCFKLLDEFGVEFESLFVLSITDIGKGDVLM